MSIEVSGAYSPDKVYGNLTSPFLNKMVHINAHPSSEQKDEDDAAVVSLSNFRPDKASARVDVNKIAAIGTSKAKEINEGSFPPDPAEDDGKVQLADVSSKKIVNGALQRGYSAQESIVIKHAVNAYESASKVGVARALSTHVHHS